jgi:hypothetical protein
VKNFHTLIAYALALRFFLDFIKNQGSFSDTPNEGPRLAPI